jgi:hypothetical protein
MVRWSTRFGTPGFSMIARYTTIPFARALFSTPSAKAGVCRVGDSAL